MEGNPYATDKIIHHPDAVRAFARHRSHELDPIFVQVMPQNLCNHSCDFCSYRLPDWKNSVMFDETKHIPWGIMDGLLDDCAEMGVKAMEITGGGEPTVYPYFSAMCGKMRDLGFETSLVTNGSRLMGHQSEAFCQTDWKWARVSIDAGTPETYCGIRHVSDNHWKRAWQSVTNLAEHRKAADQRVGVGYVVTSANYTEVYLGCQLAKDAGADNVRVSVMFGPAGVAVLGSSERRRVQEQVERAKADLDSDEFTVVDLFGERIGNLQMSPTQDYDYCGTKDVLCVVEGECNVFTCCTLTGDPRGLMGSIREQRFKDLWRERAGWREKFDVRKRCRCVCLYEKRNQVFLQLRQPPMHVNFV